LFFLKFDQQVHCVNKNILISVEYVFALKQFSLHFGLKRYICIRTNCLQLDFFRNFQPELLYKKKYLFHRCTLFFVTGTILSLLLHKYHYKYQQMFPTIRVSGLGTKEFIFFRLDTEAAKKSICSNKKSSLCFRYYQNSLVILV
jgi:hypothetical protein